MGKSVEWKEALGLRVGPRTVLAAFQMLSTLFEHARRFGWAVRNPCEFIHAPSYEANADLASAAQARRHRAADAEILCRYIAGVLFGSKMVAEGPKDSASQQGVSEESTRIDEYLTALNLH